MRWIWRAAERSEVRDPDRIRQEFATWISEHMQTHVPYLVEVGGCAVGMAWLAIIERVPGPEIYKRLLGHLQRVCVMAEHRDRGLDGGIRGGGASSDDGGLQRSSQQEDG